MNDLNLQPLAAPVSPELYRGEINNLKDHLLLAGGDYEVYLLRSSEAPNLMQELYRLREETFRAVGEGTGLPLDTDAFDGYYRQMILWNVPNQEICGAYRLGFGPEIIKEKGIEGFYTSTLFRYAPVIAPLLGQCIELGRSFIVGKYQREVLALKFLLSGLAISTTRCPGANYFMGPVSMSADIPHYYQTLAVRYLERDFSLPDADKLVGCTNGFVPDPACAHADELLKDLPVGDIDAFDHWLAALSEGKYRLPVLFRKYFSCHAKVACFNVDPLFCNSLDGLIFLKHADYPENTLRSLLRAATPEVREAVWQHFCGKPFSE